MGPETKTTLALALLIVTAAGPAFADRRSDKRWRWEGGVAFWLGSVDLGRRLDEDDSAIGLGANFDLGMRRRRWLLTTELGFLSAKQTQDYRMPLPEDRLPGGFVRRAGIAARYSVKQFRPNRDVHTFGGDLWLELGAGVQNLRRTDEDRQFSRGDVKIGVGGEFNAHAKKFHVGYYYALSVLFTRVEVPSNRPATCAGPCDTATQAIPLSQTFLFHFGVVFGG